MQTLAILLLVIACAVLTLRVYAAEKSMRDCARQLQDLAQTGSGSCLRIATPSRTAEELMTAVNHLLEDHQAEAANYRRQERAIRQQISNISHDLRTPLTSILGYLQLLEGNTLTPEERREYMTIVRGRAKSLQGLITSFYDLSRLEGGEFPLVREKVDLYHVLSRLVAEFYNDFINAGFDMTVALAEGLPMVLADPSGVLRVFTNLIRNAMEHGKRKLSIRLYAEGGAVISAFTNDAEELAAEDVGHVFDRFFTADKMRTEQSTGLGLAIVKSMTAQMGHTVGANMEQDLFTVWVRWKVG